MFILELQILVNNLFIYCFIFLNPYLIQQSLVRGHKMEPCFRTKEGV